MSTLLNPSHLLNTFGVLGVFVILFAETGLLIGFFLPGDSLLFTAGLLAATSATAATHIALVPLVLAAVAGALTGAEVGYLIGRSLGPRLLDTPGHPRRAAGLKRAGELLDRYGHGRAVVLARFIPVVRTLMNPLAGAVGVPAARFAAWQGIGGAVWAAGITLAGYFLGRHVPNVDHYLLPIVAVVVLVSLVPVGLELHRSRARDPGPDQVHHDR
ncbi:DedA family protein [Kineococcus rhizosphaerae]|uniref:Membrane-associated protein n=1 Tax=Kineococcus rhizosphaerae TaxID=559628 RepID=A0A2T0QXH2_9ACTN|nr:DedA family protein [Kineococcus rhizosphaerae]PRY10746.1 membrane-associated protein [Kineococcus rhizosphaerae]